MELTIQELKELKQLTDTQPTTPPHLAGYPIYAHLIGERTLIRTYTSGVTIGILEHLVNANGQIAARFNDSVRIWRWEDAFTLSELAANGGKCRIARHPDGIVITDQGAELIPVTDKAWADIEARWIEGAQ